MEKSNEAIVRQNSLYNIFNIFLPCKSEGLIWLDSILCDWILYYDSFLILITKVSLIQGCYVT